MRCTACRNGELHNARHHKSATRDGHVAVVTNVPVTRCPSCGTVWYAEDVAIVLDAMLNQMLTGEQFAVRSFEGPQAA